MIMIMKVLYKIMVRAVTVLLYILYTLFYYDRPCIIHSVMVKSVETSMHNLAGFWDYPIRSGNQNDPK
jgi:hypothetical protein